MALLVRTPFTSDSGSPAAKATLHRIPDVPPESEERDGWRREPDDSAMMEAYFDAKCGGEDGDWADIAFEASLYEF